MRNAYLSPTTIGDAWPGLPTIGASSITVAQAQQISDCLDWLIRRMGLRREPLFQGVIRRQGPFQGQTTVYLRGSVTRSTEHPTLKALVQVQQKQRDAPSKSDCG
ncbi:MAG: hypothetical protein HC828_02105 [Blastochloris sp.]|nr:hypothetical protein [Blastochloris sp.]